MTEEHNLYLLRFGVRVARSRGAFHRASVPHRHPEVYLILKEMF